MSLLDTMPHSATVQKRTRTKGSLGGSKDSPTTVYSGRACWLQLASDGEKLDYQKRGIDVTDKLYFAADPLIDETHTVVIGSDTYKVKSSAHPDASAGMGILWRVMLELQ